MRRMLPVTWHPHPTRIRVRIDCTCHDPTVFGHLSCSRAETQPNNTPPRPPSNLRTLMDISGLSVSCTLQDEIQRINELQVAAQDANTNIERLTEMLRYLNRRYGGPPPHG